MTLPGLLLRFGSFLIAHLPLQEPGARATLLFNETGLLPNRRHKAVAGGVLLHPTTPANSTRGTFLGNTNPLLARQSVSPCPLGCVSSRGKNTQSCLLCIIPLPFPGQPQPTLPPWGRGETRNHAAGGYLWSICYRNPASKCLSSLKSSASLNCHIFKAVD